MGRIVIGVDATRNRSGGTVAHLQGIFNACDPRDCGVDHVHLLSYKGLLDQVDDRPWLTKHIVPVTRANIFKQLCWQRFGLIRDAKALGCDLIFNTDAGTLGTFAPSATLSQNLLPFEAGERQRFGYSKMRLRLELLRQINLRSMARADLQIYLTEYASQVLEENGVADRPKVVIGHGIDDMFRAVRLSGHSWPESGPINCIYVSNITGYKHQWHVVEAISRLRQTQKIDISVTFVGGGEEPWLSKLTQTLDKFDPERAFVSLEEFLPHGELPKRIAEADIFLYASSCENQPVTLLEGMAAGRPICSSDRGPMREILQDAAFYFDPERPDSIVSALQELIANPRLRAVKIAQAKEISDRFTWQRCAHKTWQALAQAAQRHKPQGKPSP